MIYITDDVIGVYPAFSTEESEVINRCNFVTEITPNGETWQYNYCFLSDDITLWNVSLKYIADKPHLDKIIKRKEEIYPFWIRTLMIDTKTPKYTAVLSDGTILNGICRNGEKAKDIKKAVDEWAGIDHEESKEHGSKIDLFLKYIDIFIAYQNNNRSIAKTAKALNYAVGYVRRAIMTINNFTGTKTDNE